MRVVFSTARAAGRLSGRRGRQGGLVWTATNPPDPQPPRPGAPQGTTTSWTGVTTAPAPPAPSSSLSGSPRGARGGSAGLRAGGRAAEAWRAGSRGVAGGRQASFPRSAACCLLRRNMRRHAACETRVVLRDHWPSAYLELRTLLLFASLSFAVSHIVPVAGASFRSCRSTRLAEAACCWRWPCESSRRHQGGARPPTPAGSRRQKETRHPEEAHSFCCSCGRRPGARQRVGACWAAGRARPLSC